MNLLQLSQSLNLEDREWTSMLQTGLSDVNLSTLSTGCLPPKNAATIYKLIAQLDANTDQRDEILTKLIHTVLGSFNPITRTDYLWYLKFTVTVLLLKDLPVSIIALQGHLLTMCFSPSTTIWDANPVKMDYFAGNIYDLLEDDKNLIFITSLIENRSTFGFYLSMSMLWKSIYRCIGEEKDIFRLYPPSNLIDITKKISLKPLDKEFETVLTFIILHSKMSSLIFHRKQRTPHYKCYEEFFTFDASLIKILKEFLENMLLRTESMWRRDNENFDYLTMIEYLQIDISETETLYKHLQK